MNLSKLFDMQRELDAKIIKEKGLEDMDRLPYLILALQVELGECANEWRGFKFWSEDREPRIEKKIACKVCNGTSFVTTVSLGSITNKACSHCNGSGFKMSNPLLEEYVDCLHFILSIGLHIDTDPEYLQECLDGDEYDNTINLFLHIFDKVGDFSVYRTSGNYKRLFEQFIVLGEMLGFTWEQIEHAYMSKNAVNHERQANGY